MGKLCIIGLGGQTAFLQTDTLPHPGQTVRCSALFYELGGKGYNQAVAAARMGVQTLFIGAVGADEAGAACRRELEAEGIETVLIRKDTPTASAVVSTQSDGENTVEVFPGAARALTPEDLQGAQIAGRLRECSCILLQNEISAACTSAILDAAEECGVPVILNPAPASADICPLLHRCRLITPNLEEARLLLELPREAQLTDAELARRFAERGVLQAIVTDGARGSILLQNGTAVRIAPYHAGSAVDTTGAGDVFNGVLAACLVEGAELTAAAAAASVAAGIAVTRHGAASSAPGKAEVSAAAGRILNRKTP